MDLLTKHCGLTVYNIYFFHFFFNGALIGIQATLFGDGKIERQGVKVKNTEEMGRFRTLGKIFIVILILFEL